MTPLLFFSLFSFHGQQVGAVVFAGTWRDGLGYSRLWFGSASAATLLPIRIIWIAKLMKIMGKCASMLANSCWCCENWLSMPSRACLPPGGICLPAMWRSPSNCVAFAIRQCGVCHPVCFLFPPYFLSWFPPDLTACLSLVSARQEVWEAGIFSVFFWPFQHRGKHERGEETRLKNRVWLKLDTWTKVNETLMKPRVFSFASFQNVNSFALNQLILQLNKLFCFILATRKNEFVNNCKHTARNSCTMLIIAKFINVFNQKTSAEW